MQGVTAAGADVSPEGVEVGIERPLKGGLCA